MYSFTIRLLTEDPHQRLGAIGASEVINLFDTDHFLFMMLIFLVPLDLS